MTYVKQWLDSMRVTPRKNNPAEVWRLFWSSSESYQIDYTTVCAGEGSSFVESVGIKSEQVHLSVNSEIIFRKQE